ncbi:MAG TPA: HupE/UreJ family protein [Chthoniobacterales bacterium]|nr:HupE/UreJ family protein [Chthoniobacterales bacterium]
MRRCLLLLVGGFVLSALDVRAHPVAQGAMDVIVSADHIELKARVSNEEAFVAEAFGQKNQSNATLEGVRQRHAQYLLAHLHLRVDEISVSGRLVEIIPPRETTPEALIGYTLWFDLPPGHRPPAQLHLEEDVLNEFVFAPGNRWEASYIVRFARGDEILREGLLLTSRQPLSFDLSAAGERTSKTESRVQKWEMALAFLRHGIAHILGGYDHLLFVAGLVLAVASLWDLLKVVTAFTVAHTITLTLAVLDVVRLSDRIVEPMIAASIVFVALQNLFAPARSRGWARLVVAFGFGLFHGLGFAGGLLHAMEGMRGVAIATAIAAFSIGVELGHQMVALPLFAGMQLARSYGRRSLHPERVPLWLLRAGSSVICIAGGIYLVAALR